VCAEELARHPAITAQIGDETVRAYDAALALDPNYANALRGRAAARIDYAFTSDLSPPEVRRLTDLGIADARKAAQLAPALGAAHSVIGNALAGQQDYAGALAEFNKALALSPGDARVYRESAGFMVAMGNFEAAITQARRGTELDPLSPRAFETLQYVYYYARRYQDSLTLATQALQLGPDLSRSLGWQGLAYIQLHSYEAARAACVAEKMGWVSYFCLAIVYERMGRHPEAEAALAQLIHRYGDSGSFQQADVYADRGDSARALEALQRAHRTGDPGLQSVKVDPLLDRIRDDPGFKALVAQLNFPEVGPAASSGTTHK
jgi:tetratricopeptide (TPR) repeat protein